MAKILYNNFVTGLINPTMTGRVNSDSYYTGAEELTNVIVRPDGSLMKRNGFRVHLDTLGETATEARAIQIAKVSSFYEVIFIADGADSRVEIYDNDTQEKMASTPSPYTEGLLRLQISSYMGDLYITGGGKTPQKLTFDKDSGELSISSIAFAQDTVVDVSDDSTYPTSNLFYAGRWWVGGESRYPFTVYGSMVSTAENGETVTRFTDFTMKGQIQNTTCFIRTVKRNNSGMLMGDTTLQYSEEDMKSLGYDVSSLAEYENPTLFSFNYPDLEYTYDGETKKLSAIIRKYYWKNSEGKHYCTSVERDAEDKNPKDAVTEEIESDTSHRWIEAESFEAAKALCIPDNQLTVSYEDDTVLSTMTLVWKYVYKASDVEDENAIQLTEADSLSNPIGIRWMFSDKRMLVGFGKIIMMDSGTVPTPESFDLKTTVQDGCGSVCPVGLGNYVIYTGINDMSVRTIRYDYDTDGYLSTDISANISQFIHEGEGVCQMATQLVPFPIVWVLLNDGTLLACSFNPDRGLIAWSKVVLGQGRIKGISIFNKYDSNELEYLEAVVSVGGRLLVETMELTLDGDLLKDGTRAGFSCYLDNSRTIIGKGEISYEDAPDAVKHVGSIAAVTDDSYSGIVTMDTASLPYEKYATIGSPFTARIGLLPLEYAGNAPLLCVKRRIVDVTTRVYKTGNYTLEAKDYPATKKSISCMFYGVQDYNQAPTMYTGNDNHNFSSYAAPTNALVVESEMPFPLNLLAVAVDYVFESKR